MDLGGQLELAGYDFCQWLVMVWILGLGFHENDELMETEETSSPQRLSNRLLISVDIIYPCECWKV